jgi:hypothetical protein
MSLEAALAANTEALKEVAALLRESNEGRAEALAAAKAASGGTAPRGRKPKGQTEETKSEEPETEAPAKQEVPSADALSDKAKDYLAVNDQAQRDARLAALRELTGSLPNSSGKKIAQIEDEDDLRALASGLKKLIDAGDIEVPFDDEV